jgi:hypothetical protein
MSDRKRPQRSALERAARIAFTFVVMNVCAVTGLLAVTFRRKVWR